MAQPWATPGFDPHVEPTGPGLRKGLTKALREAVRSGRLAPGTRLPASRTLAADLGIARDTVADTYADPVAEGWLTARKGSGTRVADRTSPGPGTAPTAPRPREVRHPPRTPSAIDRRLRHVFDRGRQRPLATAAPAGYLAEHAYSDLYLAQRSNHGVGFRGSHSHPAGGGLVHPDETHLRRDPDFSEFGGLRMSRTCHRLRPRDISGHHRPHEEEGDTSMAIQRMDNVGIVVEDMDAAIAFFVELGMELEGRAEVEGPFADQCTGLDGVHCDIAMVRTPDGHSRLELAKYRSPAVISAGPRNRPHNILGTHRVMFAVDDIKDTVARLRPHGAELVGEIARFEDSYLLCYLRGPEGIIVGLAEQLR